MRARALLSRRFFPGACGCPDWWGAKSPTCTTHRIASARTRDTQCTARTTQQYVRVSQMMVSDAHAARGRTAHAGGRRRRRCSAPPNPLRSGPVRSPGRVFRPSRPPRRGTRTHLHHFDHSVRRSTHECVSELCVSAVSRANAAAATASTAAASNNDRATEHGRRGRVVGLAETRRRAPRLDGRPAHAHTHTTQTGLK